MGRLSRNNASGRENSQNEGNLSNDERNAIFQKSLTFVKSGKLCKGALTEVSKQFNVCTKTVSRIWHRSQENLDDGKKSADVSSRIKLKSGGKRKHDDFEEKISSVPVRQRSTIRSLAAATSIPRSTLHLRVKEGALKRVSSTLKPALTESNKKERLRFALSMLEDGTNDFKKMYDVVHVDEKWFYITKIKSNFYLLPEETGPIRTTQNKRFITKVMFLCAVARPRWDPHRKAWFDGKVGLWPCIDKTAAMRSSKNRERGTLVSRPFEVNRERYLDMIVNKVIPAIKAKWPVGSRHMHIKVQQDNARPHVSVDHPEVVQAGKSDGFNISLMFQPPNSPDFNVLDLGFFNAIQALQQMECARTVDELILAVEKALAMLSVETLNDVQ